MAAAPLDPSPTRQRDDALDMIAARQIGICNLSQKDAADEDHRDLAVVEIRGALEAAYAAGQSAKADQASEDRAPDCTTARAATIAGIISEAVMAGDMSLDRGDAPDIVERRIPGPWTGQAVAAARREGFRVAGLMIGARARASVRTPSHAAISAAEAALALAEDTLDPNVSWNDGEEEPEFHAVLASIRDTLRAGLAPLHAADGAGQAPYDAGPPSVATPDGAGPSAA